MQDLQRLLGLIGTRPGQSQLGIQCADVTEQLGNLGHVAIDTVGKRQERLLQSLGADELHAGLVAHLAEFPLQVVGRLQQRAHAGPNCRRGLWNLHAADGHGDHRGIDLIQADADLAGDGDQLTDDVGHLCPAKAAEFNGLEELCCHALGLRRRHAIGVQRARDEKHGVIQFHHADLRQLGGGGHNVGALRGRGKLIRDGLIDGFRDLRNGKVETPSEARDLLGERIEVLVDRRGDSPNLCDALLELETLRYGFLQEVADLTHHPHEKLRGDDAGQRFPTDHPVVGTLGGILKGILGLSDGPGVRVLTDGSLLGEISQPRQL